MLDPSTTPPSSLGTTNSRGDREQRILDAAAELLARHGYRRVTVDDVARGSAIGKGTIYLHWRSREELFRAVVEREVAAAVAEVLRVLRDDPHGWRPARFAHAYFLAVVRRPLLTGLVLADSDLLGSLTDSRNSGPGDPHPTIAREYFACLADAEVLAAPLEADTAGFVFQATLEGFVRAHVASRATDGTAAEPRAVADLLAHTLGHALERDRPLPAAMAKAIAARVVDLFTAFTVASEKGIGARSGETPTEPPEGART